MSTLFVFDDRRAYRAKLPTGSSSSLAEYGKHSRTRNREAEWFSIAPSVDETISASSNHLDPKRHPFCNPSMSEYTTIIAFGDSLLDNGRCAILLMNERT